jgi:hypothetical protein
MIAHDFSIAVSVLLWLIRGIVSNSVCLRIYEFPTQPPNTDWVKSMIRLRTWTQQRVHRPICPNNAAFVLKIGYPKRIQHISWLIMFFTTHIAISWYSPLTKPYQDMMKYFHLDFTVFYPVNSRRMAKRDAWQHRSRWECCKQETSRRTWGIYIVRRIVKDSKSDSTHLQSDFQHLLSLWGMLQYQYPYHCMEFTQRVYCFIVCCWYGPFLYVC